jgi:iron complex outermembrane receptor protein
MSTKTFKKGMLASSIALVLAGGATPFAMAAEEVKAADEQTEVIEVKGIRGSLKQALNTKRFSNAVIDSISAADIGKFPDNNIAESLARIPGISVSRQFGEGSAVSIRGASNNLTLTTLNGQNVSSSGWYSQQAIDRSFNYSMIAPEMVSGLDVYKSSQADIVEGGVGGTVIVKTRKPLELDSMTMFASLKSTYSTASEESDPSASALLSWKNEDETFGILGTIATSEYSLTRRGDEGLPVWGGRIAPTTFEQSRDRTAYDIAVQFAPTDTMQFGVHYMSLELDADSVNTAIWIPQNTSEGNCEVNAQGAPIKCTTTADWAAANPVGASSYWDVRPRNAVMESNLLAFDFTYEGDGYQVEAQFGHSEATGGTNFETNVAYIGGANGTVGGAIGTIDATGDTMGFDLEDSTYPLPVAGEYFGWEGLQANSIVTQPREEEEDYFQIDVEFDTDFGVISSVKTGFRWSDHEISQNSMRPIMPGFDGAAQALLHDGSEFTSGTLEAGMDHLVIPAPNGQAMVDYTKSFIEGWTQERSGYSTVAEEITSLYVMANIDGPGFRGNFGFRYVSTEVSSDAFALDPSFIDPILARNNGYTNTIVTDNADYNEVLPSLNLVFDLADDVLLRFSAASVMTRPNYNDMFTNTALVGYGDNVPDNGSVTRGNVGLSPFKAFQSDLGVEWYYSPSSMVSIAYYLKDVNTFTTFANDPGRSIGIIDPDTGEDSWNSQVGLDGDGGEIRGVEFQWQHDFDNGFGGIFNYTFAEPDADADNYVDGNAVFSDASKHTTNFVAYYEGDAFSARAAYSWRSEYMIRETGFYGNREHQDYGSLDLSASYIISDNITITADATNVLEEDSIQVGRDQGQTAVTFRTSNGYPAYSYEGEARYSVGVQVRF